MVELELLQRGERTVAFLGQRKPALFLLGGSVERLLRPAEERPGDEDDGRDREQCPENERSREQLRPLVAGGRSAVRGAAPRARPARA